jgi:DNA polymerase-1
MKPLAIIDFETEAIEKRPVYPPKPVGVAIIEQGKRPEYLSWNHPCENNCTKQDAKRRLKALYRTHRIVMHGAKFDLEVGEKFFDLPLVPPNGFDCTLLLAFLHDPREPNLKLKPLADRRLDMPPEEQEALRDWIYANVPGGKQKKTKWGELIARAPGKLVGRYAKGDVVRTKKLRELFYTYVKDMSMLDQYEIEKRTIIKAIELEREGVMVDAKSLVPDLEKAERAQKRYERALYKVLGEINLNSGPQKVAAFEKAGLVDEWEYTDKGNEKTGIDSLIQVCTDKQVVHNLDMFSKYTKIIGTYMRPWLKSALENDGRFFPWFNTIKGDNDKGTYTGRFSSNFQQVPREPLKGYRTLPFLRNYIIPDHKNHLLFNRDFSSQEIRILAHFEDGELLEAYHVNPKLDVHDHVKNIMIEMTGGKYDRTAHVKPCNFLVVYGGGAPALSKNIHVPLEEARGIITAHGDALPGVKELKKDLLLMSRNNELFKTAGGRWYDFEEGFEYVALNTLIQGSAADHTKIALLNIDDMLKAESYDARIVLTVHDEFMISGAKKQKKKLMKDFKEAMEYDELFDLPMLTDGKIGACWGKMEKMR